MIPTTLQEALYLGGPTAEVSNNVKSWSVPRPSSLPSSPRVPSMPQSDSGEA